MGRKVVLFQIFNYRNVLETILKINSTAKIYFLRIKRVIMVTFKTYTDSQNIIQNCNL